ncbi:MAG: electron transfer flavoprotein subunit alpha [Candidatus Electrothrix sp. LOE1_4_5]|nr:electron transfer flavoprotein subunit alpha [Candidatus Electrothrix gigas]
MLIVNSETCIGCGVCEANCAFGAITVENSIAVVGDSCTLCGSCVENCEPGALRIETAEKAAPSDLSAWSGIWVFAEARHGKIAPVAFELLGIGRQLADQRKAPLTAVLLGADLAGKAENLIAAGADKVLLADDPVLAQYREDVYGKVLKHLVTEYKPEVLLAGATAIGRSVIPQVATALNAGLTADCTDLAIRSEDGVLLQTRPAFGGNIMATIECPRSRPQMATVRPNGMAPAKADASRTGEVIEVELAPELISSQVEVLETVLCEEEQGNIRESEVLVSGGRGVENEKGFELLRELAEELNGTVAASRAAVDAGWIGYPCQVGQTGKTVSPKLYIACGISGAVQHTVGMQSAETIIAINRDEKAPIFDLATYGLVGNLFEILPLLTQKIKEQRGHVA